MRRYAEVEPPNFFFQAEDGIRDGHVTGVQTCALPIYRAADARPGLESDASEPTLRIRTDRVEHQQHDSAADRVLANLTRSEERRVGKECRSPWPRSTRRANYRCCMSACSRWTGRPAAR